MTELRASTVGQLDIPGPTYDRDRATPGVVHLGVGNFHRSHQAVYLDRVLQAGDLSWGICGVGLLAGDEPLARTLRDQDLLYTSLTVDPDGTTQARVIGSLVQHIYAPDDPKAVLDRLAAPSTRIVSLTITEGGYGVQEDTGKFNPDDPLVLADLAGNGTPRSALGLIVAALKVRRQAGTTPFTVVSCDNIQSNGKVARSAVTGFAAIQDPELASWIQDAVVFPSSMVDRITPVTTPATRQLVQDVFGVPDRAPVLSESYLQWVLEDDFPAGRPDLDQVGVQLVGDVLPYELMKLRLLNASHQVMSYLGILAGFEWVHETCQDPDFDAFLRRYMDREARPTLAPVPGVDLDRYCQDLMTRFASPAVGDTLQRQVVDGSERLAKFLVPVIGEQLRNGGDITCAVTAVAAWGIYAEQRIAAGADLADRRTVEIAGLLGPDRDEPGTLVHLNSVFGVLGSNDRFRREYEDARSAILQHGSRHVVNALGDHT